MGIMINEKLPKCLISWVNWVFPVLVKSDVIDINGRVWNEDRKIWEPKYDPEDLKRKYEF